MRILFLTKSKPYTNKLLKYLVNNEYDVRVVCKTYESFNNSEMEKYIIEKGIVFYDDEDLYKELAKGELPKFDLVISNTYGRLIKKELINWVDGKIINLHGAILPKYRGVFSYNWGIYNSEEEWGVTAHYVNEKLDEGDIIRISRFEIDSERITVKELETMTQEEAYYLTISIIKEFRKGIKPNAEMQSGEGTYYSRKDFEKLKHINKDDTADIVEKKIQSCWCPPHEGAYIEIGGTRYNLINRRILESLC